MDPITNCLCDNSFDSTEFMIQCDVCRVWYHGECISIKEYLSTEVDKFHCSKCESKYGPTTMKIRANWHRHDYTEMDADGKPVQTGTPVFIRELKSRHFANADEIVKHLKGQQLTMQYLQTNGFEVPIVIDTKDGLDIIVPSSNFSISDIENYIGGDREMDVIDVTKQSNIRMKLKDFVDYYNNSYRPRILNVISLEFTNTSLSPLVEAPYIARKLDWVNNVWPRDWPENNELKKPEVQKYCLMGVKDSFTDFHIDFGGTSVWYHVLRGEKIFYLIKPTSANLHLYQQWMCSSTQSETFFGDQVDACYKCILKQGQTMMIPTGWIHAVLTPIDSLVFGGNFVHSLNIPMQIQIYEMEKKMKTPLKFQYPGFETINWFAAKRLLKELKDLNSEDKKCPDYLLQGIKALLSILKIWNTDKDYNMVSRRQIPVTINSQKLLKDLSKEIRHAERFLMALNPPKPERESKRRKKKPFNKDFIDFNVSNQITENAKMKSSIKYQSIRKAPINSKFFQNIPPLKLTLPKSVMYSCALNTEGPEPSALNITTSTIKTLKTLTPMIPSIKNLSSNKCKNRNKSYNDKKILNPEKVSNVKKTTSRRKNISKLRKQNPTVIRFKLGDKEVIRSTKDKGNNICGNFTLDHAIETRRELTWKHTSSVYDFHDGSNESDCGGFTIDEKQKKNKTSKSTNILRTSRLSCEAGLEKTNTADIPKNGIEELLKASVYTLGANIPRVDVISSVTVANYIQPTFTSTGASPSTRDAIAGMLSFSEQCYSTSPEPVKAQMSKSKYIPEENDDDDDLLLENINKVHQDDDFIYPALDVSDEDEFMFKSKGKREQDEAWNPKARVGPLLPKPNRPARDSAKKTSVEKGLIAAAKKRAKQSESFKRSYRKKRKDQSTVISTITGPSERTISTVVKPATALNLTNASNLASDDYPVSQTHTCTSILSSPNRLKDVKAKLAAPVPVDRKPKKGMKTAKQRLGKILKIHKMLH